MMFPTNIYRGLQSPVKERLYCWSQRDRFDHNPAMSLADAHWHQFPSFRSVGRCGELGCSENGMTSKGCNSNQFGGLNLLNVAWPSKSINDQVDPASNLVDLFLTSPTQAVVLKVSFSPRGHINAIIIHNTHAAYVFFSFLPQALYSYSLDIYLKPPIWVPDMTPWWVVDDRPKEDHDSICSYGIPVVPHKAVAEVSE